jgi:hypothetical protein
MWSRDSESNIAVDKKLRSYTELWESTRGQNTVRYNANEPVTIVVAFNASWKRVNGYIFRREEVTRYSMW